MGKHRNLSNNKGTTKSKNRNKKIRNSARQFKHDSAAEQLFKEKREFSEDWFNRWF